MLQNQLLRNINNRIFYIFNFLCNIKKFVITSLSFELCIVYAGLAKQTLPYNYININIPNTLMKKLNLDLQKYLKGRKNCQYFWRLFIFLTMIICSNEAFAQTEVQIANNIEDVLPNEIFQAIANNNNVQTIFNVSDNESFSGQILQADQIIFSDGAHLKLQSIDVPWIVIMANTIAFQNVDTYSRISFSTPTLNIPLKATRGSDAAHGNGLAGGDGAMGQPGMSHHLPNLYIIVSEIHSPTGVPPYVNLAILGNGIDGGRGGAGGDGGNGGRGANGRHSRSDLFFCTRGAGNGQTGGNAGRGGRGGDGGNGGNGVSLTIVSTMEGVDLLRFTRLQNNGGFGGESGQPGIPGEPGFGGDGGSGSLHCSGGDAGARGAVPQPTHLGFGNSGSIGAKGIFTVRSVPNIIL